jgi:hypothetical protein
MECWSIVFVIPRNRFCGQGDKSNSLTRNPESKNRNVSFQYSSTPILLYPITPLFSQVEIPNPQ